MVSFPHVKATPYLLKYFLLLKVKKKHFVSFREIRAHQDSQVYQEQMVQKDILVLGVYLVLLAPQGLQEETSSQTLRYSVFHL